MCYDDGTSVTFLPDVVLRIDAIRLDNKQTFSGTTGSTIQEMTFTHNDRAAKGKLGGVERGFWTPYRSCTSSIFPFNQSFSIEEGPFPYSLLHAPPGKYSLCFYNGQYSFRSYPGITLSVSSVELKEIRLKRDPSIPSSSMDVVQGEASEFIVRTDQQGSFSGAERLVWIAAGGDCSVEGKRTFQQGWEAEQQKMDSIADGMEAAKRRSTSSAFPLYGGVNHSSVSHQTATTYPFVFAAVQAKEYIACYYSGESPKNPQLVPVPDARVRIVPLEPKAQFLQGVTGELSNMTIQTDRGSFSGGERAYWYPAAGIVQDQIGESCPSLVAGNSTTWREPFETYAKWTAFKKNGADSW